MKQLNVGVLGLSLSLALVAGCATQLDSVAPPMTQTAPLSGAAPVAAQPDDASFSLLEKPEHDTIKGNKVQQQLYPTGRGIGATKPLHGAKAAPPSKTPTSNGIDYHGGPVMLGTPKVHIIWYGNWSGNSAKTILPAFIRGLSGSPYFNINKTYYSLTGSTKNYVTGTIALGTQIDDAAYSRGKSLVDADIKAIVESAINTAKLPKEANSIYLVLTTADVKETSGFCSNFCGWHDHATIATTDIKYSFVGNPDQCPSGCEPQTTSPNGNAGADGMASIIAHELEEAITDPDLNAWYDKRGYENADKGAWTFGTTSTATNGSKYNMAFTVDTVTSKYLIQQNWVNAGGGYAALAVR